MSAPDLDPSALARLREQVGNPTVERLVELFRANVEQQQKTVRTAVRDGDTHALTVAFHSIKGSAQLVGAKRLEEVSGRWELAARTGALESIDEALEEIARCFALVERALDASSDLSGPD